MRADRCKRFRRQGGHASRQRRPLNAPQLSESPAHGKPVGFATRSHHGSRSGFSETTRCLSPRSSEVRHTRQPGCYSERQFSSPFPLVYALIWLNVFSIALDEQQGLPNRDLLARADTKLAAPGSGARNATPTIGLSHRNRDGLRRHRSPGVAAWREAASDSATAVGCADG